MDFNVGFPLAGTTADEVVGLLQRRARRRAAQSREEIVHGAGRTEILAAIAAHARVPYLEGAVEGRDRALCEELEPSLLRRALTVPVCRVDGQITVALANPYDHSGVDYVRQHFPADEVAVIMAPAAEIEGAFGLAGGKDMRDEIERLSEVESIAQSAVFNLNCEYHEPLLEILRQMFNVALGAKASDIHVWTEARGVLRRAMRVSGQLCLHEELNAKLTQRLDAVLMSLLGIDRQIAWTGRAIDSRVSLEAGARRIPVRYARTPAYHGYHITLRLFGQATVDPVIGQGNLRFRPPELLEIDRALEASEGMIAIVGATGSGKSTTLFAMLKRLAAVKSELTMTLENPVEQEVAGVIHQAMQEERDFDMMIKSVVRSDPDNIMIGEIRDLHTGMRTLDMAVTGHLVLTTMHANSATEAITRARNWGMPIFDLLASLRLLMAQKLVPVVCENCATIRTITDREVALFRLPEALVGFEMRAAREGGCERCFRRGYAGVDVIAEVVPFDARIVEAATDADRIARQVREAVRAHFPALTPLKEQAIDLVRRRITDLNAVKKVVTLSY